MRLIQNEKIRDRFSDAEKFEENFKISNILNLQMRHHYRHVYGNGAPGKKTQTQKFTLHVK